MKTIVFLCFEKIFLEKRRKEKRGKNNRTIIVFSNLYEPTCPYIPSENINAKHASKCLATPNQKAPKRIWSKINLGEVPIIINAEKIRA